MYALVTYGLGSEFLLLDSYHAKNSFPDSMKIFGVLAVVNRGVIKSHITLGRHSHTKFTEPFNLEFKILTVCGTNRLTFLSLPTPYSSETNMNQSIT